MNPHKQVHDFHPLPGHANLKLSSFLAFAELLQIQAFYPALRKGKAASFQAFAGPHAHSSLQAF